jgi:hypothetical protein
MSHDDPTQSDPPSSPSDWVQRLKGYTPPPGSDPVGRLAQHMIGQKRRYAMGRDGVVEFGYPKDWKAQHPFRLKTSMAHTDHAQGAPFSHKVAGGYALVCWLSDAALPAYIRERTGIADLEVQCYFPPDDAIEATRGTDHALGAALLFGCSRASEGVSPHTREHDTSKSRLLNLLPKVLYNGASVQKARKMYFGGSGPAIGDEAFYDVLEHHSMRSMDEPDESTAKLSDGQLWLRDVAVDMRACHVTPCDADGTFPMMLEGKASSELPRIPADSLDLSPTPTHLLQIELNATHDISQTMAHPDSPQHNPLGMDREYYIQRMLAQPLANRYGSDWQVMPIPTRSGSLVLIGTTAPNQKKALDDVAHQLIRAKNMDRKHQHEWQSLMEERGIHDRPPGR